MILRPAILSASHAASGSPSPCATPTSKSRPGPMAEIFSPATVTEASLTRWRTMRKASRAVGGRRSRRQVVPVLNPFFGWVPAEEDDASPAFVREVEQAHIQVLEDYAELPDATYGQVEVVRLYAVLGTRLPAAVAG